MTARSPALALSLLVVLCPVRASAQQASDEARRYFEAGNQAYEAARYSLAATAYEEAYARAHLPAIAFSAAQAHRRQYFVDGDFAHLERARALYHEYLDDVPEAGRREHAVTHLATIDVLLAQRVPTAQAADVPTPPPPPPATELMVIARAPGARASIDGGSLGEVPLVRTVSPAEHRVRVEAPGFVPAEERWPAIEGHLVVADVQLAARPARLEVRAPEGATIAVDAREIGRAPLRRAIDLPAGAHRVTVTKAGRRGLVRTVLLPRGGMARIDATLAPTTRRVASMWVIGTGAAAGVGAAVTACLSLAAQGRAQDLDERRRAGQLAAPGLDDYRTEHQLRDDLRGAAIGLAVAAVAAAVTGALLWWIDPGTAPRAELDGGR